MKSLIALAAALAHWAGTRARATKAMKREIDAFADEKGSDGQSLRPDFDELLDPIIELFHADANRDVREAYEIAQRNRRI